MAKKRFTAGMDSLFDEPQDQTGLEEKAILSDTPKSKENPKRKKKSEGKGFRNDLKAFLQEAFEESFEQQIEQKKIQSSSTTKKSSKPKGGLDALLRSTIEPSKIKLHNKPVRRLTISFEETKLEKLKRIARLEKTYLKDIIDEIVGEFIEGYESDKGPIS